MDEAQKNSLIQQRIKNKMMENKKKNAIREEVVHTKRLKSGTGIGDKLHEAETEEQLGKPHSSIRLRRPASAFKAVQSMPAVQVPIFQPVEIDFKGLLQTVFGHGVKVLDFLKENNLDPGKYFQRLQNNELFTLSVQFKLKQIPQQKHTAVVQKEVIGRITRELSTKAQLMRCQQAQKRITQRLDDRLRMLSNHSV